MPSLAARTTKPRQSPKSMLQPTDKPYLHPSSPPAVTESCEDRVRRARLAFLHLERSAGLVPLPGKPRSAEVAGNKSSLSFPPPPSSAKRDHEGSNARRRAWLWRCDPIVSPAARICRRNRPRRASAASSAPSAPPVPRPSSTAFARTAAAAWCLVRPDLSPGSAPVLHSPPRARVAPSVPTRGRLGPLPGKEGADAEPVPRSRPDR